MDCIIIRKIDLPETVPGVTRRDEEGDYNVYLNARLSYDAQAQALQHEVAHIKRGDFYDERRARDIEKEVPY